MLRIATSTQRTKETPRFDTGATGDAIRQDAMDSMRIGGPFAGKSEPGAVDPQSPLPGAHGDAVVQLHAACLIAVQHDPTTSRLAYSAAEYEIIRSAVAAFVTRCRTDGLSPERVLVLLKSVVNEGLRTIGREPQEIALREIILEAFLHSYYGEACECERDTALVATR